MEHPQLEQFIYEHGEELLRLAYTYVKKHDVAEDIVQDVLLKAFEQREQFLGQSSYRTYLYRMTINRCYDYFRSWSYRNTIVTEQITKFMKKPDLIQPNIEEESYLGHCLLSLPLKYREVLILYYYKDLSQDAIADLLSISVNTVKTRMVRGREKLKKLLKEEELLGEIRFEEKY